MKTWYVKAYEWCNNCHDDFVLPCLVCKGARKIEREVTIEEFMSMMGDVREHETWMNQD